MKRMYDESEIKQIVLEVLNDLGIYLNEDGRLEITIPIKFEEVTKFGRTSELHLPDSVYFEDGAIMTSKSSVDIGDDDILVTKYYL